MARHGLFDDLNLARMTPSGSDMRRFFRCNSIFWWSYVAGTPFAAVIAQKSPLGKYVGVSTTLWAGISPAFSLITAMWYRPHEQPLRITIWLSFVGMSNLVGPLVACAISQILGALSVWQYQYLIFCTATALWGIATFVLPDNLMTA
ncbi:uncharacterized protein BDV17DRAFT_289415 [Aspergillus undulatus]|uniref:uncharacterized protein n=1 Tax=Aspergillus undulatus TaxID=1810928 RepID=UPI003CCD0D31